MRTLATDSDSLIFPQLTTDPTAAWTAEGGTITASDPVFTSGTAIPHKLAARVEYSNEVAADSSPELEQVLRTTLTNVAAEAVDVAAYEGSGSVPTPLGMGNVSAINNVNASTAATSILWAGSAISLLEGANAPRPYVYVGSDNLPRHLRSVRVDTGGTVGPYLFPVGSEELPTIYGARGLSIRRWRRGRRTPTRRPPASS